MSRSDVAAVAGLFADRSRAAMVDLLLDGRDHTVQALARAAHVAPSTASEHLGRLEAGGVVVSRREGRERLVRLAGPAVAAAYEGLAQLSRESSAASWFARLGVELDSLPQGRRPLLRVCTDWTERREHLAGALGAAVCAYVLSDGWVVRRPSLRSLRVTPLGEASFRRLGVAVNTPDYAAARREPDAPGAAPLLSRSGSRA